MFDARYGLELTSIFEEDVDVKNNVFSFMLGYVCYDSSTSFGYRNNVQREVRSSRPNRYFQVALNHVCVNL